MDRSNAALKGNVIDNSEEFRKKKQRNSRRKKRKKKFSLVRFCFVSFIIYFIYTVSKQCLDIHAFDKKIAKQEAVKVKTQQEADKLKTEVDKIGNKDEYLKAIEEIARNKYNMVKPNEVLYIDNSKGEYNNKIIPGIGFKKDIDSGVIENLTAEPLPPAPAPIDGNDEHI